VKVNAVEGAVAGSHRIEEVMFPYTASPATALTIAAMMTAEDIAAADARRVAQEFHAARRAQTRRRSPARNTVMTPSGFRSMIWRRRSGRLAHTVR
jgi:hypothetical protein